MSDQSLAQAESLLDTLMVLNIFRQAVLGEKPVIQFAGALKAQFDIVLNPDPYEHAQSSLMEHLQQAEEYIEQSILGVEEARTFIFNFVTGGPAVRITATYNADTFSFYTALEHRDSGENWQPLHLNNEAQSDALKQFSKRIYDNYL